MQEVTQLSFSRTDCRLCGHDNLELALPMKASPIGDAFVQEAELDTMQHSYSLDLYLCAHCTHLQLLEVVDPNVLFGNYIYSTATSPGLVAHYKHYAQHVIGRVGAQKDSLVVEIGSNDGSLLKAFKQQGLRILGVDPASEIAQRATRNGLTTMASFFTEKLAAQVKAQYGSATIIAANNVFAHVDNMVDLLRGIRLLLSQDGVFVFEVSYLLDVIEKNIFNTIYHEHLSHYSISALQNFFKLYGMQLYDIERIDSKGGSIRGYAKLASSSREVKPIINELLQLEKQRGLDKTDTYLNFAKNLEVMQQVLHEILDPIKQTSGSIMGLGASVPMTTIIYQFELGKYLDCLIDDNPVKQGRYSPGLHLPVKPIDTIYETKPACVVILAWAYADKIIEQHQRYLDEGGCFVVPLPTVRVVKK